MFRVILKQIVYIFDLGSMIECPILSTQTWQNSSTWLELLSSKQKNLDFFRNYCYFLFLFLYFVRNTILDTKRV